MGWLNYNQLGWQRQTHVEGVRSLFEEVEETASFSGHLRLLIFVFDTRIQLSQRILRVFPVDFVSLNEGLARQMIGRK